MSYGARTPKYQIPVATLGDRIDPEEERIAALTIENQLMGAIAAHSGGDGVISTGTISATFSSGNSSVTISPDLNGTSLQLFIRQIFVRSIDTLNFTGIPDNTTVFLIAQLTETGTTSSRIKGQLLTTFNTSGIIPDDGLLIATATTTGAAITISEAPIGRINIDTLAVHAGKSDNPHGNPFQQDNIETSGLKVFNDLEVLGDAIVHGNLKILSGLTFEDGLEVFGETEFHSGVTISGLTFFIGSACFSGAATFKESAVYDKIVVTSGIENRGDLVMFGDLLMTSGHTIDNMDPSADHDLLTAHINNTNNPHNLTIEQLSGLSIFGGTLLGNLDALSGVTVDGLDVSALKFLIDGSNADPVFMAGDIIKLGHKHDMSGIATNFLEFAPEYPGAVLSGTGRGVMSTMRRDNCNFYSWNGQANDILSGLNLQQHGIVQDIGVPGDFRQLSGITIKLKTHEAPLSKANSSIKSVEVFDTTGSVVTLKDANGLIALMTKEAQIGIVNPNSFTWDKGKFFSAIYTLESASGTPAELGSVSYAYGTTFPS